RWRSGELKGVACADVLFRLDDAALVVVARGQAPCGTRRAPRAGRGVWLEAVQQFGDRDRVAAEHLRHPEAVVEADECVGDDELALRQVAACFREPYGRLERSRVVIAEVADDGGVEGLCIGHAHHPRAGAQEGMPAEPAL